MATRPDPATELARDIGSFAFDPYRYARYAFPWGVAGTPLADSPGPRVWQREQQQAIGAHLRNPETRFMPMRDATVSGHGIGKTANIGILACWAMDTCVDTRVVVTANTEQQIRIKLWPEIIKWRKLSITRDWWDVQKTGIFSKQPGHRDNWRCDAETWSEHNTEAFQGLHNVGRRIVIITDESSKISDKVAIVIGGALTDENTEIIWLAYGNGTQNTGWFRECFGVRRNVWTGRQIDSRTVEGTNKVYLQSIIDTYGIDNDITKVRVLGQFPSASSLQFIPTHLVEGAQQRQDEPDKHVPLIMGVDVARYGDDDSVIRFRRGNDARSIPKVRLHGVDTMTLAAEAMRLADEHEVDLICVDTGGVGAGVADRLKQKDYPVEEVQFGSSPVGFYDLPPDVRVANRRAEMYALLREWLKTGMIDDDQQLHDDLVGVEYGFNVRDQIQLERKEHMKDRGLASPDDSDALALTHAPSRPVYPTAIAEFMIPPITIPAFWPQGFAMKVEAERVTALWAAFDKSQDVLYITTEHSLAGAEPSANAAAIVARGKWKPGILETDDGTLEARRGVAEVYAAFGLELGLADRAADAGVADMRQRIATGRMKVFESCTGFFREFRAHRRDEKGEVISSGLMDCARILCRPATLLHLRTKPKDGEFAGGTHVGDRRAGY